MERGQFTFYRSYFEAVQKLPAKSRERVLMAMISYALDGKEETLTGVESAVFLLMKPTIDNGRKKAEVSKQRWNKSHAEQVQSDSKAASPDRMQNGCKTDAKRMQSSSKKEKEKEKELEIELEIEKDSLYIPPVVPPSGGTQPQENDLPFSKPLRESVEAWIRYKAERRETYKPTGQRALLTEIENNAKLYGEESVSALIRQSMASNWQGIPFDRLSRQQQARLKNGPTVSPPTSESNAEMLQYLQQLHGGDVS